MDETEKRYVLDSSDTAISIINMECGMRETIAKAGLSPEVLEFLNRLDILIKKDLIGAKQARRR